MVAVDRLPIYEFLTRELGWSDDHARTAGDILTATLEHAAKAEDLYQLRDQLAELKERLEGLERQLSELKLSFELFRQLTEQRFDTVIARIDQLERQAEERDRRQRTEQEERDLRLRAEQEERDRRNRAEWDARFNRFRLQVALALFTGFGTTIGLIVTRFF